jgi:AcrR family transcriptional regulator
MEKRGVSHNLLGQRLGRKGRDTRERILAATQRLLSGPPDTPMSLSAVAREASLGMTTLYLYFSDLPELLLAALEPIMASAEAFYVAQLRARWPDENLGEHCHAFIQAYHGFWARHTRILHLRNSFADAKDARIIRHRIEVSTTLINLFIEQMGDNPAAPQPAPQAMAIVLLTGIERLITIATDVNVHLLRDDPTTRLHHLLWAEARLLEFGIRDGRTRKV